MNRDDLLKRCVDRRVAHETSVVAVSHLFYVYLLSALKKGQQVEVPNFGTFGTHMVGVKRQRRMPFFEVEKDLAEKVNERYRNLKTLLVGKYQLIPAEGEVEYADKEPKYDPLVEKVGKEIVLDTDREITVDDFQREVPLQPLGEVQPTAEPELRREEVRPTEPMRTERHEEAPARQEEQELALPIKEKKLMPKLNLRGEGKEDETQPVGPPPEEYPSPPPTLRDISAGEGPAWWLQILLGLLILGAITYALNHYGIVHFWGKKSPTQSTEESLPPVVQPPPVTEGQQVPSEGQAQKTEETPTPTIKEEAVPPTAKEEQPAVAEKKEEAITPTIKEPEPKREVATTPRTGAGRYTIQVSSWPSRSDADRVVRRLGGLGFDAYVAEGFVKGRTWYRVRVGRYPTTGDAQTAAANLKSVNENGVWVTKVD